MADSTYTKGDTWPPLRFKLKNEKGALVPFTEADSATALILGENESGATVRITGTAVPIDPPDEEGFNGEYVWDKEDLSEVTVNADVEVSVVWDESSEPPKVQTFPNKNPRPSFEVVESNAA